jgi:hypothetical protein
MAGTGRKFDSLRLNRPENERLILALLISLAVHLAGFGGYELGKAAQWFPRRQPVAKIKTQPAQPVVQNSDPVEFAFSEQPTPDAPQNAKYYSDKNSRAANPDAAQDTGRPKLNGKQTDVPQTHDAPRTQIAKAQPQPETPQTKNEAQPSQPMLQPGDWSQSKLRNLQERENNSEPRPRTIKQALAEQSNLSPGVQMEQEGGVRRQSLVSSLDAKATPFGKYDETFVKAVTQHWYDLLDSQKFAQDRSGKVTLRFHLNYDGTISDMEVLENTVGELLSYVCQEAIVEPAPYEQWPGDMRRMVGANFREITFTFYYY